MKIKYSFNNSYIKYQNEAFGIAIRKNKLKKNPNAKTKGFLESISKIFALTFFPIFIFTSIFYKNNLLLNIMSEVLTFIFLFYFILIVSFFVVIFSMKIMNPKGTIEINKDGILDKLEVGYQTGILYNQIELIVITNKLTVIITKLPVIIVFTNENLNKIKFINTIKKITDDIQIIDKTNI